MTREPSGDCEDITIRRTKGSAEALRREPLVIHRRASILLLIDKLLQRSLLFGAALKNKNHPSKRCGICESALIKLSARQRVGIAGKDCALAVIDSLKNPRPWSGHWKLRRCRSKGSKQEDDRGQ